MVVRCGTASALALSGLLVLALACQPSAEPPPVLRYEVHAVQTSEGPILVRFDSASGAVARSPLAGGRAWTPIGDVPPLVPGEAPVAGRFGFDFASAPSILLTLLRFDRQTGEVWRLAYPRDRQWVAYREEGQKPVAQPPATRARPVAPESVTRTPKPAASAEAPKPRVRRAPGPLAPGDERPFVEAIASPHLPTTMRVWAIEQLGSLGKEFALEPLLGALGDADPEVVRVAIQQLATFEDPKVVPAIRALVDDEREPVRKVAVAALAKLE